MARYRKIDTRTLNDANFNNLTDDGKLIFYILLTHPHLTLLGAMRATLAGLASEIGWPIKKLKKALSEELLTKMIRYDESASFLWIPNFLKYNQPESPNVIRSWASALDYLPECTLKYDLIEYASEYVMHLSQAFQEALPQAFRKGMSNQKQKQEQKQKPKEKDLSGRPDGAIPSKIIEEPNYKAQAIEVLNFLNEKTNRRYRLAESNIRLVIARLRSGVTVMDCRQIIAKKIREWKDNPKMTTYTRPATLFNEDNFEQYFGEIVETEEDADGRVL